MATYFVASGGSNTAPYDTWAKAATSIATALAAASSNGDYVVIQYNAVPSGDAELSADTTYTFAASIFFIAATNDGGSAWTAQEMGTSNWIGNSTTNRAVSFAGGDRACWSYGITLRTAGSTADSITLTTSAGQSHSMHKCYIWSGNTNSSSVINLSGFSSSYTLLSECTWRFGHTNQNLLITGKCDIIGGSISSAGSQPSVLFDVGTSSAPTITITGADLTWATGTLVDDLSAPAVFIFDRCKLAAGVVPLASQTTNPTLSSGSVFIRDSASGDTHGVYGFYNALGSVVTETGIYFTASAAAKSWKIVTTANCSRTAPFRTPPIIWMNPGLSAITPRIEILRDGSATAFTDDEVWAEFLAKTSSGSTQASVRDEDGILIGATPANQAAGAGLGSWTGESGTAWSGKLEANSLTPAELGDLTGSVLVGLASTTVYANTEIEV